MILDILFLQEGAIFMPTHKKHLFHQDGKMDVSALILAISTFLPSLTKPRTRHGSC